MQNLLEKSNICDTTSEKFSLNNAVTALKLKGRSANPSLKDYTAPVVSENILIMLLTG